MIETMFRLFKASEKHKQQLLEAATATPVSSPHLLTLAEGINDTIPNGFVHDFSHSDIGRGQHAFDTARNAFLHWRQFDLGWVQVVNPSAPITRQQLVGVEAHTAFLWSLNLSRVVETVDSPTRFGFVYATTALHVEEGEERFVIEYDQDTESVSYLIEAVSRPRDPLARLGYVFARAMQHKFARDSHARMKLEVLADF
jgi:uncharacterized protein (UPF0548 family)